MLLFPIAVALSNTFFTCIDLQVPGQSSVAKFWYNMVGIRTDLQQTQPIEVAYNRDMCGPTGLGWDGTKTLLPGRRQLSRLLDPEASDSVDTGSRDE